mgnify:CR=1 FL=1
MPTMPLASSTAKAKHYAEGYRKAVGSQEGLCLGSYAFLWGHKQETTATWFGMFLEDGSRLGAVDAMTELWSGKPPADPAPVVEPLVIEGEPCVDPGAACRTGERYRCETPSEAR